MNDKTMAEVADKAVDKIAGGVEAIAKAVEEVAPHVWEVLVRQAFAEGVAGILTGALTLIALAIVARFAWKKSVWELFKENLEFSPIELFLVVGYGLAAFFALAELRDGLLHVMNPQYYAAKELIEAAK